MSSTGGRPRLPVAHGDDEPVLLHDVERVVACPPDEVHRLRQPGDELREAGGALGERDRGWGSSLPTVSLVGGCVSVAALVSGVAVSGAAVSGAALSCGVVANVTDGPLAGVSAPSSAQATKATAQTAIAATRRCLMPASPAPDPLARR